MKLTFFYATTKELAITEGITYDQARYQVNKMVKEGKAEVKTVFGKNYYCLPEGTELTINDSFSLAQTYRFNVRDNRDKHLAINFASSFRTNRKNAQVAMSKFINSTRQEANFYGLMLTK